MAGGGCPANTATAPESTLNLLFTRDTRVI